MVRSSRGLLGRWISDPRQVGGKIRDGEVEIERAVLLETCAVAEVTSSDPGKPPLVALELAGRINRTTEEATILVLCSPDALGMIVAEGIRATHRAGPALKAALAARFGELARDADAGGDGSE